jgi:hypothetical protein
MYCDYSTRKFSCSAVLALVFALLTMVVIPLGIVSSLVLGRFGFEYMAETVVYVALFCTAGPAAILGVVGILIVHRHKGRLKGKSLAIVGLIAGIVMLATIPLLNRYCRPAARKLLPSSAKEIRDQTVGSHYPWDSTGAYYLKAKIGPEEFQTYLGRLNFVPVSETLKPHINWFQWNLVRKWWDPTPAAEGVFCDPQSVPGSIVVTKYENGYVYFMKCMD